MVSSLENRRQEIEPWPRSIALLFPGQGMHASEFGSYYRMINGYNPQKVAQRFRVAEKETGLPLQKLLKEFAPDEFSKTSIVQPVVYTLSVLGYEIFLENSEKKKLVTAIAGHSLGEYSALTAAGVIPFEDGIQIVAQRGRSMEQASDRKPTGLSSIFGLTEDQVKEIATGNVSIALVNAPELIVVGGPNEELNAIEVIAKEKGARKVGRLDVSGAFHTPFMESAAKDIEECLDLFKFEKPSYKFISNNTGLPVENLKKAMVKSMTEPVRWADTIKYMRDQGIEAFVEVGPGISLKTLCRANGISPEKVLKA